MSRALSISSNDAVASPPFFSMSSLVAAQALRSNAERLQIAVGSFGSSDLGCSMTCARWL